MIKCFTGEMFLCWSKFNLACKSCTKLVPAFFLRSLLTTYLITLSVEKGIIVLEKVLNFGS